MKKLLFIVNPRSGRTKSRAPLFDAVARFSQAGYLVYVHMTDGPGDATRVARELGEQFDLVVCSGGDGTLNETISGLMQLSRRPWVGYLPNGSTNDFAASLHIPSQTENATEAIVRGDPFPLDIGTHNGRSFAYVASFGAFTRSSYSAPQATKNALGHFAYILEGLGDLDSLRPYHCRVVADGEKMNRRKLLLCTISNGRICGGEFLCAPRAELDDGLMEVCCIRPMLFVNFLRILPHYRRGAHLDIKWARRRLSYRRASHVDVFSKNLIDISLDGEILTGHKFSIDILPGEISLVIPSITAMKKRFEPIVDKCGEIIDYLMSSPDIPDDEALQFKIRLSIEEAVENVVRYAYDGGLGWIEVGTDLDPEGVMLTILLKDAGVPFNPLEKPDPDITLSAEDRQIGGLGIFLCKQLMDHIYYKYEDGCNVLIMKKKVA